MPRHHSAYHRFYGHGVEKNDFTPVSREAQRSKEEEKDQMKHLNNRLVNYVDKVHDLEIANKILSAENARLQRKARDSDQSVPGMYENEIVRLRARIEDLEVHNKRVEIERVNIQIDCEEAVAKYKSEKHHSKDLEKDMKHLRKDVDDATLERAKLETKVENLSESLALEKQVHEAEMENLRDQLQPLEESVFSAEPGILPDLNDAIINVRKQYEDFNSKSLEDLDGYYKDKVNNLIKQLKSAQDDARQQRMEVAEKQKIIIRLERELEQLRGVNNGLEKSIEDLNDRLERESEENKELVDKIHHELDDTKEDLGKYLKGYQKLHSLNMSLEQEIGIYQKVLAGEEARISEIDTSYRRGKESTISSHHSSGRTSPSLDRQDIVNKMMEEHND